MCFLLSIILLCDCARLIVAVVCSGCRHQRIPRSVVAIIIAPSVIVSSTTDPPRPPSPQSSPTMGASGEPWTTTMMARPHRASQTSSVSRRLLRAHCPCSSPSSLLSTSSFQNALPKVGGGQSPFRVGVVVILCHDAAAVIALPILPPNEQRTTVNCRH